MFEYPEPLCDGPAYRDAHARMWRTIAAHVEVLVAEGAVEADAALWVIRYGRRCTAR